nr:immunoglobulin heavy chain junction region [Macaca mulatta]
CAITVGRSLFDYW